jgi:hypothetical protein
LALCDVVRVIDCQTLYGRAPSSSLAGKQWTVPLEVILPGVETRVEQFDSMAGLVVTAGQIWPFLQVAMLATPTEVYRGIITAMLFGDDVIDMKGKEGFQFVR